MADTSNKCPIPAGLTDCCIKPEAYFVCAPYKQIEACVADRSDGAYVAYSVAYRKAYAECQAIKESSQGGSNKQFNTSFANSFK